MNNLSTEEIEVLNLIRDMYSKIDFFNPFCRGGVTADNVAFGMGWYTDKILRSGLKQADLPKSNKVIKELIKKGYIIDIGKSRTLNVGSPLKTVYKPNENKE